MNRKLADLDPRAIAMDLFRRLDGMAGMTKWGKTHRSQAYQLIAKLMAQPIINNNNVQVTVDRGEGDARQKLEDAVMRIISARKLSIGDPAVYVDGKRLTDGYDYSAAVTINGERVIEHDPLGPRPATIASTPQTPDAQRGPPDAVDLNNPKSPQKGPLFSRGGVATTPTETTPAGGTKQNSMYSRTFSSVPGLFAGASLDESADNRSTTQRFLEWPGHGRPP
jgi:hypothetical protein